MNQHHQSAATLKDILQLITLTEPSTATAMHRREHLMNADFWTLDDPSLLDERFIWVLTPDGTDLYPTPLKLFNVAFSEAYHSIDPGNSWRMVALAEQVFKNAQRFFYRYISPVSLSQSCLIQPRFFSLDIDYDWYNYGYVEELTAQSAFDSLLFADWHLYAQSQGDTDINALAHELVDSVVEGVDAETAWEILEHCLT